MQRTDKYKFDLIEGSDPFSPDPLNQNMEKTEAALVDLSKRVRAAAGSYTGTGQYGADHPTVLEIPDAERPPSVIIVSDARGYRRAVLVRGMEKYSVWWENFNSHDIHVSWTDKGACWYSTETDYFQLNSSNSTYYYAVFI